MEAIGVKLDRMARSYFKTLFLGLFSRQKPVFTWSKCAGNMNSRLVLRLNSVNIYSDGQYRAI
ncbi:MAG: hypothetical protein DRH17_10115 [Deltaproteobacteria bacterium]|nr:MAG: hypothetical protein DRH17_10115 [Deltaproteobacteria bacterium]